MRALETIKLAIVLVAGLTLGWVAATIYADVVTAPAARAEGVQAERAAWKDAQRKAEAEMEAERQAAQVRVDQIAREYTTKAASQAAVLERLEVELQAQEEEAQSHPRQCAAAPAVGESLVRRLNDIGR